MDLNQYQELAQQTDVRTGFDSTECLLVSLMGLAGESGVLLAEYKKWRRDGTTYHYFEDRMKEELGDLLWYLSNVAAKSGLTLDDIAEFNLEKTRRLWLNESHAYAPLLFDSEYPEREQIPRTMEVMIHSDENHHAVAHINGKKFGDTLTDNNYNDDGYRFHDIIHIAHATVLGWSPTLRALLKRKRKSDPKVDTIEDGGRAIALEEGISAKVFKYAEHRNYLEGAVEIDYELLRILKLMTEDLEVSVRTEAEWQQAILLGFEVWRRIRNDNGGHFIADLNAKTIEFV